MLDTFGIESNMVLDTHLFDELTKQAKESPRLRAHLNLHETLDANAQRLLVALEPGTEMPIHRHPVTNETQMVLRGRMKVKFYNDNKEITEEFDLCPTEGRYGIHTPKGQWHTLEVMEPGTIILEVKDGPYVPSAPEDILE